MKLSPRERWIVALLVPLLTASLFIWVYGRKASTDLDSLRTQISQAAEGAPTLAQLTQKQNAFLDMQDKLEGRQRYATQLKTTAAKYSAIAPEDRAKVALKITDILEQAGMQVVGRATGVKENEPGGRTISRQEALEHPEYSIEIVGTYAEMFAALKGLSKLAEPAVPVGLEMRSFDTVLKLLGDPKNASSGWLAAFLRGRSRMYWTLRVAL